MNKAHHSSTQIDNNYQSNFGEAQMDALNQSNNLEMIDPKNTRLFNDKAKIWSNVGGSLICRI